VVTRQESLERVAGRPVFTRLVHVFVAQSYFLNEPDANVPEPSTYHTGVISLYTVEDVNALA
jgi:hypothetical protein